MAYNVFRGRVIDEKKRSHRIGAAMNKGFPWEQVLSKEASSWINTLGCAHNTKPEYIFLSSLTAIAALAGPKTRVVINAGTYEEKLNTYLCILGDAGASKCKDQKCISMT